MEDSAARKNFISNCLGILRATKGRGLVVSSGAKTALGVRAPADVINLLAVWGLGTEKGAESLGVNPRGVVVNEGLKRSSFRGVVDVIQGGERKDAETDMANDSRIGKKGKGKRKPEEMNGEDTPQISKRQAKKLRLEAVKAATVAASKESTPTKELVSTEDSDTTSTTKNKANG